MTIEEVWQMVLNSTQKDWDVYPLGECGSVSVYKHDPLLMFINDPFFDDRPSTAHGLPFPNARQYILRLVYDSFLIICIQVVRVDDDGADGGDGGGDGNRADGGDGSGADGGDGGMAGACIPSPVPGPRSVPARVCKAVELGVPNNERLEEYLARAEVEVVEDDDGDWDWDWVWTEKCPREREYARTRAYWQAWAEERKRLDEAYARLLRQEEEAYALMRRQEDEAYARMRREQDEAYARKCWEADKVYARECRNQWEAYARMRREIEAYKRLCKEQDEPDEDLCEEQDNSTDGMKP